MSLAPTIRTERTRKRFTLLLLALLATATVGAFAWRTSANAGNPDYFEGTSTTQVNGVSGTLQPATQTYPLPATVFVDGAGTNITTVDGGVFSSDDGAWLIDSTVGWASQQSFANFRKWKLSSTSLSNTIVNPVTNNVVPMNAGAILRVTLSSSQETALVQVNGTYTDMEPAPNGGPLKKVTRTFSIVLQGESCGSFTFGTFGSFGCSFSLAQTN